MLKKSTNIKMDKTLNYVRFGMMAILGALGAFIIDHEVLAKICIMITAVSLFIVLVLLISPDKGKSGGYFS